MGNGTGAEVEDVRVVAEPHKTSLEGKERRHLLPPMTLRASEALVLRPERHGDRLILIEVPLVHACR